MPDDAQAAHPPRSAAPVASLEDPRVLEILSSEFSSLLSTRTLAYNEAFTRGEMFLSFVSMSFVALALLAQALPLDGGFLLVTAVVLAFDLVVGLTTYGRIIRTSYEDYRAVQGMSRIRHGYAEIAPVVLPYLTTGIHDDLAGVMASYWSPPTRGVGAIGYQLTTSGTMIGLIVSLIGGVLALVFTLLVGGSLPVAFVVGAVAALGLFVALAVATIRFYLNVQSAIPVMFPTPKDGGRDPSPR